MMLCFFKHQLNIRMPKHILSISTQTYAKKLQEVNYGMPILSKKLLNQVKSNQIKCLESLQFLIDKRQSEVYAMKVQIEKKEAELYDLKQNLKLKQSSVIEDDVQEPWSSTDFSWSQEMQELLRRVFKIEQLNLNQLQAINATMSKKDVLVVMPTGAGKSLCYQLPALLSSGITIVVSPLISLMEDQVISLKKLGVHAQLIHYQSCLTSQMEVESELKSQKPNLKLLFLTPEKMTSHYFSPKLYAAYKLGNISRIALDEVHCVEEWGSTFRPNYKNLGILKQQYPDVPLLGVTASATAKTLGELKKNLCIPDALLLTSFYPRNNLYYEVRNKPSSYKKLLSDIVDVIRSHFSEQSGIIYCFSRANCKSLCEDLKKNNINAASYYSTLSHKQKKEVHLKWLSGEIQVICATNAFGMGINKQDVRFVIHQTMSKNIETYYQESGRAGRDGLPALCLLYYGFTDIFQNVGFMFNQPKGLKRLDSVVQYSPYIKQCRHQVMAYHFGEDSGPCGGKCDVCSGSYEYQSCDVTATCQTLLKLVQSAFNKGRPLTGRKLVQGALKNKTGTCSREDLQAVVMIMLNAGYLQIDPHVYPYKNTSYLAPGPKSSSLYCNKVSVWLRTQTGDSIAEGLSRKIPA